MATLDTIIQKCTSLSHLQQLQAHLITTAKFHLYRTKLLDLCALSPSSSAHLSLASSIFRHIPFPSTHDFNSLLRSLSASPHPISALSSYISLLSRASPKPDALTCSYALKACARALALFPSKQLHSHVYKFGFLCDMFLRTTLLDAYAKSGDLGSAEKVFDEMSARDVAMWNALVAGLVQGRRPSEAIGLFHRMRVGEEVGLKPNEVTVLGALSACAQLGVIREGERVFSYIREENLDTNVQVCNAVIDMYAKCGFVDRGYWVFDNMRCGRSMVTWNTMIMGFAMDGNGVKALELFGEMGRAGMRRDGVSYLAALCACNHAGLVEEGLRLFNSMEGCGVSPNVKHYGSVVDLLGRAGRLEEAYEIIESMRMMPDVVLWQTLLGASKIYGNVDMAEIASRRIVEMGSQSCGDFVLLSNVYAARGRWDDVGRVREAMKNKVVRKVPGFSYIEVDGVIHEFHNGDKNHVNSWEIYAKMDEIRFRIKEHGYIAETSFVLHDIGDEEKENALCYHSEKLAVAFGLISASEGTPIQVIKNLRICGDCHVVIKLISKIYDREIIVRDRVRFHRFKGGSCSCRDYW